MSGIKKKTANFSQVEAGHIFVLKYTGRVVSKNIISALPASVWSKNNGGGQAPRAPPLDPPLLYQHAIYKMYFSLLWRSWQIIAKVT